MCRRFTCFEFYFRDARLSPYSKQGHGLVLYPVFGGNAMYQALYRKWRPRVFADVYGRDHITAVLRQQLLEDKLSHAYLFCGTRGTGKTTCAKILAKAVNCENPQNGDPCNQCAACVGIDNGSVLDVVEMDAASNNGVEDIRSLCDELLYLPSQVKKRVYIIDEVHMLSISAFNAILKTLEEPPAHVLFILATTDKNKIPPTVLSRCQRFDFQRIKPEVIADRVMEVAKAEDIPLSREGAMVIARSSDGAMRDALTLLESCMGHKEPLDAQLVTSLLGLPDRQMVLDALKAVSARDIGGVLTVFDTIYTARGDIKSFIFDLISLLRDCLMSIAVKNPEIYLECAKYEADEISSLASALTGERIQYMMRTAQDLLLRFDYLGSAKRASLEAMLVRLCDESLLDTNAALLARISALEQGSVVEQKPQTVTPPPPKKEKTETPKADVASPTASVRKPFEQQMLLLQKLTENPMLSAFLRNISFYEEKGRLLVIGENFTISILKEEPYATLISDAAKQISPVLTDVVFISSETAAKQNDLAAFVD